MSRRHAMVVGLVAVLIGFGAGAVGAAEELESLVKKVDAKIYYPQKAGLRSLQADVESSRLAEQLKDAPEAKNVKVTFYWSEPYKQRFVVSGAPDSMADQVQRIEGQMAMWGERMVPKPLALTLADYKCTVGEDEKTFSIDAQAKAADARIPSMKYTIDKKALLPTRWHIETANWSADVDIKYEPVGEGQSLPAEMKAKADQNDLTIGLKYKKVEKWTLPESLSVKFVGGDGNERTTTLKLSNYKLNQPIPANVFPESQK